MKSGKSDPKTDCPRVEKGSALELACKKVGAPIGTVKNKKYVLKHGDEKTKKQLKEKKITVGKAHKITKKKVKNAEHDKAVKKQAKNYKADEDYKLYIGDCLDVTKKEIKENSIDIIITDPPYPKEFIDCWSKLSELANYCLKPGGLCIAYSGQLNLPEVIERMGKNLTYYWTMSLYHSGPKQVVHPTGAMCDWKPILIYQKGPRKKAVGSFYDTIRDIKDVTKQDHKWQQPVTVTKLLIERFCDPGYTILDPFVGSGTNMVAAKNLKYKCIGIDIDKENENTIKARLAGEK